MRNMILSNSVDIKLQKTGLQDFNAGTGQIQNSEQALSLTGIVLNRERYNRVDKIMMVTLYIFKSNIDVNIVRGNKIQFNNNTWTVVSSILETDKDGNQFFVVECER